MKQLEHIEEFEDLQHESRCGTRSLALCNHTVRARILAVLRTLPLGRCIDAEGIFSCGGFRFLSHLHSELRVLYKRYAVINRYRESGSCYLYWFVQGARMPLSDENEANACFSSHCSDDILHAKLERNSIKLIAVRGATRASHDKYITTCNEARAREVFANTKEQQHTVHAQRFVACCDSRVKAFVFSSD